jgi:precorrin-2 dehydrogenase/sirohydrochlorin ferrochelatase
MDHLFPVNLNLRDRKCLVVGGGRVAERKVKSLLQCGAEIWVVSPELTGELEKLAEEGAISFVSRHYVAEDLDGCFLVISAADDREANFSVADDCFARNIPVNVVDDPARCSFTVPSILRRGSLCVAVSTEGNSPLLAKKIREELENLFGPEYAEFLELMGNVRSQVIRDVADAETRRRIFECLINSDILELIKKSKEQSGEDPNSIPIYWN